MVIETPRNFEVPNEIREFADRSVEQARKAVDSMIDTAQKAGSLAETSARAMQDNASQMTSSAMQHAQANIKAAFDLAQGLAQARTIEEVTKLQGDFIKSQMVSLEAQAREFGEVIRSAAAKVTKR